MQTESICRLFILIAVVQSVAWPKKNFGFFWEDFLYFLIHSWNNTAMNILEQVISDTLNIPDTFIRVDSSTEQCRFIELSCSSQSDNGT